MRDLPRLAGSQVGEVDLEAALAIVRAQVDDVVGTGEGGVVHRRLPVTEPGQHRAGARVEHPDREARSVERTRHDPLSVGRVARHGYEGAGGRRHHHAHRP